MIEQGVLKMNLSFERVFPNDDKKIFEIYEIIRLSGEHMYKEQGLIHWKDPYPMESIKKNCENREVFLAKNLDSGKFVHTFQLEFISDFSKSEENDENKIDSKVCIINKFATLPEVAGQGIGKLSMNYIEEYCRNKKVSKIGLDVYDKSEHAIRFYKKRGFVVTGSKPTRHFKVYLMEKLI